MSKYLDLVNILDTICDEAGDEMAIYHPRMHDEPAIEQARSRAYIHLFLKAKFGLLSFEEREHFITDGSMDGGIDAYFIDKEHRIVYFIQSKFRNTDTNFEGKTITYGELLSMDVARITEGEVSDEMGRQYNDKILQLHAEMQNIDNLGRYHYVVILLANLQDKAKDKITRLIGHFDSEVYNYERVYREILFPIVSGCFYDPKELKIVLNISKESAGHRIQYYPETEYGECTVNACYVPTIEIAKTLYKYKNAILKYNPRSFLEMQGGSINNKIAKSITEKSTNEFALFNNGITMLSDETEYSDRVGKRNTAELHLSNPQIINGGQTAFTLSRLYEDALKNGSLEVFEGKEVLLKVISFNDGDSSLSHDQRAKKLALIEQISVATNQQSPVSEADRRANDRVQVELQQKIFEDFALYYERKRGEFADGIANGYISREKIIDREEFLRCRLAIENPIAARRTGASLLFEKGYFDILLPSSDDYRKYVYAYKVFKQMDGRALARAEIKQYAKYAIVYVACFRFSDSFDPINYNSIANGVLVDIMAKWNAFEQYAMNVPENQQYYFKEQGRNNSTTQVDANWQGYYKGRTLLTDLNSFWELK